MVQQYTLVLVRPVTTGHTSLKIHTTKNTRVRYLEPVQSKLLQVTIGSVPRRGWLGWVKGTVGHLGITGGNPGQHLNCNHMYSTSPVYAMQLCPIVTVLKLSISYQVIVDCIAGHLH